jgi:hypothetical protein
VENPSTGSTGDGPRSGAWSTMDRQWRGHGVTMAWQHAHRSKAFGHSGTWEIVGEAEKREASAGSPSWASPMLTQWCGGRAMVMKQRWQWNSVAAALELRSGGK